jgi:ATP-dependent phosphofructokinase / diphosphate-dependent phosphofructokinase
MTTNINRIGVLTGGGDCPGLNAVIRAVVKTAQNEYGWEVLGIADGFEGLILPGKIRPLSFADVRGILPRGGTILGSTNRANPFDYKVVENGNVKSEDMSDQVIEHARKAGMDALVVIGGDGTLHIAFELMHKGLKLVGVPKTIDNDIQGTALSFGFDTAVNTAMEALDRLHTTAESHHRIIILEVMGRDAGWIALKAGIAGGADIILIPEIPYELKEIVNKIEAREDRGAKFSIIVVAEGALPVGGEAVYQSHREIGGVRRLGGIGETLAERLRDFTHKEVRTTVLGYLQRGGSPSAFDRLLSSRYGAHAVHLLAQGMWGHMVALRNDEIGSVPLSEVVTGQKFVPLDSDVILTAFGLGLCLGNSRAFIEDMISKGRKSP